MRRAGLTGIPGTGTALVAALVVAVATALPAAGQSTPIGPLDGPIEVTAVAAIPAAPVRIAHDGSTGALLVLTLGGQLFRIETPFLRQTAIVAAEPADHGIGGATLGLEVDRAGRVFLVGNRNTGNEETMAVIVRGTPDGGGGYAWEVLATSEPYPKAGNPVDHLFSGLVLSPDQSHLFVASGSRTDHGEVQANGGRFPGVREVPLTSAIFKLPSDGLGLVLSADSTKLVESGYLFADGFRNAFDMAFDEQGRLFAIDNGPDRDHAEELNLIVEGGHYGFPWQLGVDANPTLDAGYDASQDVWLNPASNSAQNGFYYPDPDFPASPAGVEFVIPLPNTGDARSYRAADGSIARYPRGIPAYTFTAHRSPLGLVFDTRRELPAPYMGGAFVLSWTGASSDLFGPFNELGEDLMFLEMSDGDALSVHAQTLVQYFNSPIDAVLVDGRLYVVDFGGERQVWEIRFDGTSDTESELPVWFGGLSIFPNPAGFGAMVVMETTSAQWVDVRVVDLLGREMGTVPRGLILPGEPGSWRIASESWSPGLYLVQVRSESGVITRPFVVAR